jgi:hypothetical protein
MQDFNTRAQSFIKDFNELQVKYEVKVIPIISTYGPDLQINDTVPKTDAVIEGEIIEPKSDNIIEPKKEIK